MQDGASEYAAGGHKRGTRPEYYVGLYRSISQHYSPDFNPVGTAKEDERFVRKLGLKTIFR